VGSTRAYVVTTGRPAGPTVHPQESWNADTAFGDVFSVRPIKTLRITLANEAGSSGHVSA
jgi:hypothetical protein